MNARSISGLAKVRAPSWLKVTHKFLGGGKYFNPSVLCYGPHTLKAGQSMTLRYRAMMHFGRWDAERLRVEADRYVKAQK